MALFDEIAGILREVVGACGRPAPAITPNATLEGDLRFDSVDLAAVQAALADRYGSAVDLPEHVSGLELDEIIGLTVAQVVEHVASRVGV